MKMPETHLTRWWGATMPNPDEHTLRLALLELSNADSEHPDCWLSDENSWTISANTGGSVVFENSESGEGPWHMDAIDTETVLELWTCLQKGNLDKIRAQPWLKGYR